MSTNESYWEKMLHNQLNHKPWPFDPKIPMKMRHIDDVLMDDKDHSDYSVEILEDKV